MLEEFALKPTRSSGQDLEDHPQDPRPGPAYYLVGFFLKGTEVFFKWH